MVHAGLEDKRQKVSKQDRVEQKVSVALLASRDDNCLRGSNEDETIEDSREGESELILNPQLVQRLVRTSIPLIRRNMKSGLFCME